MQPDFSDLSLRLGDSRLIAGAVVSLARVLSTRDCLVTHVPVLSQVLKSAALGLRNEQGGEDTREHEGREDLHDMVEPRAGVGLGDISTGSERRDGSLGDDGTDLARTSRDTVRGGPVASGEALSGHDEGGGVGSPVEEQLNEDVDAQHGVGAEVLEGETLTIILVCVAQNIRTKR
jgi:hypothetical protein